LINLQTPLQKGHTPIIIHLECLIIFSIDSPFNQLKLKHFPEGDQ